MKPWLAIVALVGLAACDVAQGAADVLARDQAKAVVNGVVADRFPGVNAEPITDCVIDNASAGEILSVAQASVTGVTESTVSTILEISQRPDTVRCIAQNTLAIL